MKGTARQLLKLLLTPLALPVVLLMRIISSVILIRIGNLECNRIGHFAFQTELYLCRRDQEGKENQIDIFYCYPPVCNNQLEIMWSRLLNISKIARYVDSYNRMIPGGKKHIIVLPEARDTDGYLARTPAHLSFTAEEEEAAHETLSRLGLPDDADFVCFHTRDSEYLNNAYCHADWSSHDFRDSSIQDYIPAVQELSRRGFYAVRMGAVVKEKLDYSDPRVIDYALNGRSDFLDIYLSAKCRFFICSTAGIYALPTVFRRPVAFVNLVPLEYAPTWGPDDLFIPKLLWLRSEGRLMTFKEIIASGAGRFLETCDYTNHDVEVVNNTPDEILDLAMEMDERLKGTWETTKDDEELQKRFWSYIRRGNLHPPVIVSRIGTMFLRKHMDLLD